ncbi:MAG: DUF5107 domain-containing protein [Candidatus Aminicenantes bacterium]|nr:DUF5107 domain-containing protein [Candidatus Aminicenantes bacterium]
MNKKGSLNRFLNPLNLNVHNAIKFLNLFLAIIFLAIFFFACSGQKSTVLSVKKETITTYPYSDPDPIPVFARSSMWGSGSRIYPYFVFNGFTAEPRPQDWTVVRLKNRFLEVMVFPEIGGKVWGARCLLTGKDFLYTNRVVKFREIGLRGPWTSGGIEFNFGVIGHSPATASPVDYAVEKRGDGTISCTVGNYDWPSRTRWRVTVELEPDKDFFATKTRWINPGPFRQSYYAWMCAAVPATEDLKYIFPGKYHIGHDYSQPLNPWPIDQQSRDLSWYRNNAFGSSKSYFVIGSYDNFYGGYYQKSDFGFGHWALYPDQPGKKIWIWDLSRAGEIWVDLLTDNDGQYTEPQAGRLLNQSDHGSFPPAAAERWQEIWFPYSGIGQMSGASPEVVLSLKKKDGQAAELSLYGLQEINDQLIIKQDDKELVNLKLKLRPGQKQTVPIDNFAAGKNLIIFLGKKIIHQTLDSAKEIKKPFNFYLPTGQSTEELFLAAETAENQRDYPSAMEKYHQILDKAPDHLPALCRLSELYSRRGQYEMALDYARKAVHLSMYHPEANYVYGLASLRLKRLTEAKEAFGWAARSPAYALPAYLQLAKICLQEKDYELARTYAERAADYDQQNPLPYELLAAAFRHLENRKAARQSCLQALNLDRLDHLARYELYLLHPTEKNLRHFQQAIKNEFPEQTYLELALHYLEIGEEETALKLLSLAPQTAETLAWQAYLLQYYDSKNSNTKLDESVSASPYLVFPFREESIPVFVWASQRRPDCWKFRYYLGLIYWHKDRMQETRQMFETLDQADYYPVFISRAYLWYQETDKARTDLRRALELSPEAWRTWYHLIRFELAQNNGQLALEYSLRALEKFPENMFIQAEAVKAFMAIKDYTRAAELLDRMQVLPYEGANEVHNLYLRTHLHLALERMKEKNWEEALKEIALSREYPERLGTGRPFAPDQRIQDYLEALAYEKMSKAELAGQKLESIISYSREHEKGPYAWFLIPALEKLGQREEAKKLRARYQPPEEFWPDIQKMEKLR